MKPLKGTGKWASLKGMHFMKELKIPMPLYVLQLKGDHMAVLSSQKVLLVLMEKSFS